MILYFLHRFNGTAAATIAIKRNYKLAHNYLTLRRDTMTTTAQNKKVKAIELELVSQSSAQVGIGIIATLSALIGIWATACLLSGLAQYGVVGMIKGWLSAVLG